MQPPALDRTRTDREDVHETARGASCHSPARVVELGDGAAIVGVGDEIANRHPVDELIDGYAVRCHRLAVGDRLCGSGARRFSSMLLLCCELTKAVAILPQERVSRCTH